MDWNNNTILYISFGTNPYIDEKYLHFEEKLEEFEQCYECKNNKHNTYNNFDLCDSGKHVKDMTNDINVI